MVLDGDKTVLLTDAMLVSSNLFCFVAFQPATSERTWWSAAAIALVTAVLLGLADRSRRGLVALVVVGVTAIVGLVASLVTGTVPTTVFRGLFLGFAVGIAANRFLFGVVWSVPAYRRRRMETANWP